MVGIAGHGVPLGNLLDAASPAAVQWVEPTLETIAGPRGGRGRPRQRPARRMYAKAGDADALRKRLAHRGIALLGPPRKHRTQAPRQARRKLWRYKRRGKVERQFAWLGNFRRVVGRWEHHITMYSAFFPVACLLITLRQL
jgi:hypothetical protein